MKTKEARHLADEAHNKGFDYGFDYGFMVAVVSARYFALRKDAESLFCAGTQPWEDIYKPTAVPAPLQALTEYMAETCERCLFRLGWDAIDEVLLCGTKEEAEAKLAKVSEMLEEAAADSHTRH